MLTARRHESPAEVARHLQSRDDASLYPDNDLHTSPGPVSAVVAREVARRAKGLTLSPKEERTIERLRRVAADPKHTQHGLAKAFRSAGHVLDRILDSEDQGVVLADGRVAVVTARGTFAVVAGW